MWNKILLPLRRNDLLNFRLAALNNTLAPIANEILVNQHPIEMHFFNQCWSNSKNYRLKSAYHKKRSRGRKLGNLNKLLKSGLSMTLPFPCTRFTFEGGDLDNELLLEFFILHGHNVKWLKLDMVLDVY